MRCDLGVRVCCDLSVCVRSVTLVCVCAVTFGVRWRTQYVCAL